MRGRLDSEVMRAASTGDAIAMARALVSTPSVNPTLAAGGAGEGAVAELTAGWLRAWGFLTETVEVGPGRYNVLATLDGEGPTLLLNGHLDTVGVEDMSVPPFGADIEDGRLVGRGSCDMKGGVAALLAAGCRLSRLDARPKLTIVLTADEEHASLGMASFVESAHGADLAVVCEPTNLAVMPAHKGFVWLRALFQGRSAHGSRPDIGIDAIRHAALYLAALEEHAERLSARPAHPLLAHGSFHAGTIRGGAAESVYPETCELFLERRTLPGESPEAILTEFAGVLSALRGREREVSATLEITLDRPGTEVAEESQLVQGLLAACRERAVEPRVEGMTAWVDAAFLNEAGVPAVCFGPGDIAQAHTEDEWIEVAQIDRCARVLESFALGLSSETDPETPSHT